MIAAMHNADRQNLAVAPAPAQAPERLAALAERLARTLAVARALVLSNRTVELAGLQDGIGALCAQTLDLPPAEARLMVPVLHELTAQIDALTAALHAAHRS